jgi:putative endonuclease
VLNKYGPCPEHRISFDPIRSLNLRINNQKNKLRLTGQISTKQIGDYAESIVAEYLMNNNHTIVARNHKTKFYEIDIISTRDDKIYFTEVKYRKNQSRGTSLDMITDKKLKQMTFAAESFLKFSPALKEAFSPLLAVGLVSGQDYKLDDWFVLR